MRKLHWVFIGVLVFFLIGLLEIGPPYEIGHFVWAMILAPIWIYVIIRDRKKRELETAKH